MVELSQVCLATIVIEEFALKSGNGGVLNGLLTNFCLVIDTVDCGFKKHQFVWDNVKGDTELVN